MRWMFAPFRRFFVLKGRAPRREFWAFAGFNLAVTLITLGAGVAVSPGTSRVGEDGALSFSFESNLYDTALGATFSSAFLIYAAVAFIPSVTVTVRRLHDSGLTGWLMVALAFVFLVPILGLLAPLAFVIAMALPGTKGRNRYGPDPRDPYEAEIFA